MSLTAAQIEDIVRVVVKRLRADVAARTLQDSPPLTSAANVHVDAGEVYLAERVITLESLRDRLSGTTAIVVHPKAVVTPAVRDELRKRSIRLVRQLANSHANHAPATPLLLVASQEQQAVLSRRVCALQAKIISVQDTASTASVIESNLAAGKLGAVWCSATPFACVASTFGNAKLRAIQLSKLHDLSQAIAQSRPNVVVLDSRMWSATAIASLISNWYRSLG